ncbi:tail assembly protein [Thermomonas sp.]|uniref:tail assembly protein n=1 Tax=Thermomonas sp. TaxID=1971895 RepID=UPI003D0F9AD0
MITVLLYGHLRRHFGRRYEFDIRDPAEAVRALCATVPGFRAHVLTHNEPGYRVLVGTRARDGETLALPAEEPVIRIVPVVAGRGRGFGQVLLGAALIGFAFVTGGAGIGLSSLVTGAGFTTAGLIAAKFGVALVMGGIAQMLSPTPKAGKPADNKASDVFAGPVNTTQQGNPVPLGYGRLIVGSQVISAGLAAASVADASSGSGGGTVWDFARDVVFGGNA